MNMSSLMQGNRTLEKELLEGPAMTMQGRG